MYAAAYSTADCMKLLLDARADPNARDRRDGTALMRSVRDLDKVRLLLDRGAEVDARSRTRSHSAHSCGESSGGSDVVKLLLSHKADPEIPDASGVTPLMYATDFGDVETVKALVAAGADVNAGKANGANPLYWASNGPLDVLVWLLEHKANPNAATRDRQNNSRDRWNDPTDGRSSLWCHRQRESSARSGCGRECQE